MSSYRRCDICKDWHWTDKKCNPIYNVFHEDYMGDDSKEIRAVSHEGAALGYARYYNEHDSEYSLMNDNIEVKVEKDGITQFFLVGAEPDIHYSSDEIKELT